MLATDWFMILFRILHIAFGVAWVGSVFLFVTFVRPSVETIAPAGAPFMAELLGKRKMIDRIIAIAWVSVIAGVVMYVKDWTDRGGFGNWVGSSFGLMLTIGMVLSLVALAFGMFGTRPNVMRVLAIGRQVAESGGPPSPEQAAEIAARQAKLKAYAFTSLTLLILAVIAMSTARYI
jgi:hypothetical protein